MTVLEDKEILNLLNLLSFGIAGEHGGAKASHPLDVIAEINTIETHFICVCAEGIKLLPPSALSTCATSKDSEEEQMRNSTRSFLFSSIL